MTSTNNQPRDDSGINEQQGEAFLAELDRAMDGSAPRGVHADTASFGAALQRTLPASETSDASTVRLKEKLSAALPVSPLTRLDQRMQRFRLGVLDVAALAAVVLLCVLVGRTYFNDSPATTNKTVAEEQYPEKPPVPAPEIDAVPVDPYVAEISAKLARKISIDVVDQPIADIIAMVREVTGTNIIIDPRLQQADKEGPLVNLRLRNVSAGAVLTYATHMVDLDFRIVDQAIFVSRKANLVEDATLEVYNTHDLVVSGPPLVKLIVEKMIPAEFADPATSIESRGDSLVVVQRNSVQTRVREILKSLNKRTKLPGTLEIAQSKPNQAVLVKLKQNITIKLKAVRAPEGARTLSTLLGVPIICLSPNAMLNIDVKDMAAEKALKWLCSQSDLTYRIVEEGIVLESSTAYQPIRFAACDVSDLSDPNSTIAEFARTRIRPDRWDSALGTAVEEIDGRLLVIADEPLMELINQGLPQLRRDKNMLKAPPGH